MVSHRARGVVAFANKKTISDICNVWFDQATKKRCFLVEPTTSVEELMEPAATNMAPRLEDDEDQSSFRNVKWRYSTVSTVPEGYWFCDISSCRQPNQISLAPNRCSCCGHGRCSCCIEAGRPRPSSPSHW